MKAFKKHWCVRPLSYMLSLYLVVLPLVLTFLGGGLRAQAQVTDLTRQALPQWAVLDFTNDAGYGGAEIGRQASDSFVLELGKTNKIDVVPRQQIIAAVQSLGLSLPLDTVATQKLGRELNVDAVVVGSVATVAFDGSPRRATSAVIIRVVDVNTGLLINGAIAQGASSPRPIPSNDDDSLVNQSIDNASFAAVKQIVNYSLPKGTIMQDEDENTVLLNKGTKHGMYDGLDMVVTRRGSEVGRIRVSRAGTDNSDAVVTVRGAGIAPEDVATAIFQLPHYSVRGQHIVAAGGGGVVADNTTSGNSTKRSSFTGIGGILASVLIGALLITLVKRGSSNGSLAGAQPGSPTAVEIGQFDPTGLSVVGGQAPGLPNSLQLPGDPSAIALYSPVAIHVTATTGNVNPFLWQEYHVYRPDFTGQNVTIISGTTTTIGLPHPGQLPVLSQASQQPLNVWDDGSDRPVNYTTLSPITNTTLNVTSGAGFVVGTGIHENIVGKRWQYTIDGLWQQSTTGTTGTTTAGGLPPPGNASGYNLTSKVATNAVTYLQPVILTSDSFTGVGPTRVFLTLQATLAADDYVLELASSPAFSPKKTLKPFNTGLIQYTAASQASPRQGPEFSYIDPNAGLDMTQIAAQLGNPPAIYARVGVRDSRNGSDNGRNPYLYSQTVTVPTKLVPVPAG